MKRLFDLILSIIALSFLILPLIFICLAVRATSQGSVLYWSARIGRDNQLFNMPKFRTMQIDTPVVATHLLKGPHQWLTPIGSFLRKFSLDELPQLWSIFLGHMSFVGPRPALYNQLDLITSRTQLGIQSLRPGLTGWAQVNGRDEITIAQKVKLDAEYMKRQGFWFDIYILWKTLIKIVNKENVSH